MKINSEKLWEYINELATGEKVKFNVYYDDQYVTQIYWDGENFRWEPGTFTTGALFNPLYDFVVVEEQKKIPEKLKDKIIDNCIKAPNNFELMDKINSIIDYLESKGE